MLYLIGLGLSDEKDISVRGLEAVKRCKTIYLENYTSALIGCPLEQLEAFYGKKITPAERTLVEQTEQIVEEARTEDVALLVIGDPLAATTHLDIMMRAREKDVAVKVIHNASVMTAVGLTGLQLYKFGKTVTVPYPEVNFRPEMYYEVLRQNKILGLHTLLLLDLKPKEKRYMTISEAITLLEEVEGRKQGGVITPDVLLIGCARLGSGTAQIVAGKPAQLKSTDFGSFPYCIVVPGEMHFMEAEAVQQWTISDGKNAVKQKI